MSESEKHASIPCPVRAAAKSAPELPAIIAPEGVLRYGELDRQVSAASTVLIDSGCTDGARVAFLGPPDRKQIILLLAVLRAGGVACPLSTRVPAGEVPGLLRRVGARIVITDEDLPQGYRLLHPDTFAAGPGAATAAIGAQKTPPAADPGDASDAIGPQMAPPAASLAYSAFAPDRPATILFTSGSTGTPAAALHSYGNHYFSALGANQNIPLGPGDAWLLSLPLFHVGGLAILFRCLTARAAVVLPAPETDLSTALSSGLVSHVSMVATQLWRLLRDQPDPPAGLRAVLLGGSAIPADLTAEASRRGYPVATSYGLTEMASQVTTTPPGANADVLETAGRLLPHRELRIAPDGEILVRGDTLFLGYVDGDAVHRPVDIEGWYHTRDLGRLDDDGLLRVLGRADHLFISGGENVQPEEVEAALHRLAGVRQAVVVPVPDPEFGHRPVAFMQWESRSTLETDEMRARLAARLPRFKIPVAFFDWPEEIEGMKADRLFLKHRAEGLWRRTRQM